MSFAAQIAYSGFDRTLNEILIRRSQLEEHHVDSMGKRLRHFSHHRLTGSPNFRLRAGNYRVVYAFDVEKNVIHLLYVGHRREVYR